MFSACFPELLNSGVSERVMHKNRLQEYTQKSSLQLPVYQTVNEGAQHAPRFRTTVLVDGTNYTSEGTFPNRKSAEQDAARIALQNIQQKMKNDGCPIIREDTTFCKSILNEYAIKMHLEKPSYRTIQPVGLIPVFVSSLVFNGVSYTGDIGRNKKEAEQLAARVCILSILDSAESESATVMSEIIKSKCKLYAVLNKIKDSNSIHSAAIPVVNTSEDPGLQLNKRKEAEVTSSATSAPVTAICQSSLAESANIQASHLPLHQFKKTKPETNSMVIAPHIIFIPPGSGQPLFSSARAPVTAICQSSLVESANIQASHLPLHQFEKTIPETSSMATAPPTVFVPPGLGQPVLSSASLKRSRRNKKKAKMGVQIGPLMPAAGVPLNQIPTCSVAQ